MKPSKVNAYISSLFALLISTSLVVSTLHSHNHIEWHHPKKHVDTGTCLIADSSQCPICGYFSHTYVNSRTTAEVPILGIETCFEPSLPHIQEPNLLYPKGRSPPVLI